MALKKKQNGVPRGSRKGFTCETKYCRNPKEKKTSGGFGQWCSKCRSRRLKERHPHTYVLNFLRGDARKRGIEWTVTSAQFKKFCDETGYLEKRGVKPKSLTIGRIDHSKGYHIDNIRVEEHAVNSHNGYVVPGCVTQQNTPRERFEPGDADETGVEADAATDAEVPF